jgi:dTDP-4-dehydrorhamnose reductase
MRVLMLGGTGLLGCSIAHLLAEYRITISTLPRQDGPHTLDLLQRGVLESAAARFEPDAILNLVALANVDDCERDPERAQQLNATLPGQIAATTARWGVPLVHISTDMLYDGEGPHPESAANPRNVYARTKWEGERCVIDAGGCALRTNFFGPSRHPVRRTFSDWILEHFRSGRKIQLLRDVLFSPLSTRTLAQRIAAVLRAPAFGEVLNLGSREGLSKRDFALILGAAHGITTPAEHAVTLDELHLAAHRPRDMRMNVSNYEKRYSCTLPTLEQEILLTAREQH